MIRDFNLFPEHDINIVEDDAGLRSSSVQQKTIVERRLEFPNFANPNGASVADLGHHAGYYQIEHSHAARYVIAISKYLFSVVFEFGGWDFRSATTDPPSILLHLQIGTSALRAPSSSSNRRRQILLHLQVGDDRPYIFARRQFKSTIELLLHLQFARRRHSACFYHRFKFNPV